MTRPRASAPPHPAPRRRLPLVDALRGFAIVQMILFHFVYCLRQFGYVAIEVNGEQPWATWRLAIVSQFLLLAGASLVLRAAFVPAASDFWRRWGEVAAAAAIVSFGSWLVLGERWIRFGILHAIAVALVVARRLVPLGAWNLALGALVVALGVAYADPRFDAWPANVLGFATSPVQVEDHVPLFPWLGVVLAGSGLGALWRRRDFALGPALARWNAAPPRTLVFLGRWPLTLYLVHVPILVALISAWRWWVG